MTGWLLLTALSRGSVPALRFAQRHASAVVCLLVPVSRLTRTRRPVCLFLFGTTRARGQQTGTKNTRKPGRKTDCPDQSSIQTP
jgi:hypothetical protein